MQAIWPTVTTPHAIPARRPESSVAKTGVIAWRKKTAMSVRPIPAATNPTPRR